MTPAFRGRTQNTMKIPKAAWWNLVPFSSVWQYLVYVPAHLVFRAWAWFDGGSDPNDVGWNEPKYRPWMTDRLR
jgi:hypothetical protein